MFWLFRLFEYLDTPQDPENQPCDNKELQPLILKTLDDDCLYETMKRACLDINDLVQIALTCTRFEYTAKQVFRTKFQNVSQLEKMQFWTLEQLETFLILFGEFCRTFVVDWQQMKCITNADAVLQLLAKYCKKLERLKLYREESTAYLQHLANTGLRDAVESVKLLDLVDFSRVKFDSQLQLKVLRLNRCRTELPEQHFTQLMVVVLIQVQIRQQNVEQFFKLNPQISRVEFAPDNWHLQSLGDAIKYLVNLKELTYVTGLGSCEYYDDDTKHECFEQLKKLECLRLKASDRDTFSILKTLHRINAPLKSLDVAILHRSTEITVNLLIDAICQFKLLKKLVVSHYRSKMEDDFHGRHLLQVIGSMPQLEYISCSSSNINFRDVYNMLSQPNQLKSILIRIAANDCLADHSAIELTAVIVKKLNIRAKIVVLYRVGFFLSFFYSNSCASHF